MKTLIDAYKAESARPMSQRAKIIPGPRYLPEVRPANPSPAVEVLTGMICKLRQRHVEDDLAIRGWKRIAAVSWILLIIAVFVIVELSIK